MATDVAPAVDALPSAAAAATAGPSAGIGGEPERIIGDTLDFIFKEYDMDKDGLMTRKEFFTFLWELKSDPAPKLTEGQMISSWNATDLNKNGSITLAEFRAGLDICYDNHFFAAENGVAIPESIMITQGIVKEGEDLSSYNTVKFKKSLGVAFFDQVLDDEKKKKEAKLEEERKKREVKTPTSIFGERIPYKTRAERAAERAAEQAASGEPAGEAAAAAASAGTPTTTAASSPSSAFVKTPSSANMSYSTTGSYATRFTARNSSATAQVTGGPRPVASYLNKVPVPAGRPGFAGTTLAKAQAEKEAKRLEAQRNIEKIAAERYQEERRRREEERLKREAERKAKLEAEAGQQSVEPEWKRNMRTTTRK